MAKIRKILMLVENLSVPADSRVWAEATTLRDQGFQVSIICLKGPPSIESRMFALTIYLFIDINCPQSSWYLFFSETPKKAKRPCKWPPFSLCNLLTGFSPISTRKCSPLLHQQQL